MARPGRKPGSVNPKYIKPVEEEAYSPMEVRGPEPVVQVVEVRELPKREGPRLIPVRLRTSYVPLTQTFNVVAGPGEGILRNRLAPGTVVELPVEEARGLCEDLRAIRADAFPED